jgi:hypothetical protein
MEYFDVDKEDDFAPLEQSVARPGSLAVAEYLVSPLPWVVTDTVISGSTLSYRFPRVTSYIYVVNNGSASQMMKIGFTKDGVEGSDHVKLYGGHDIKLNFRLEDLYLRSDDVLSSSVEFSLEAGLTKRWARALTPNEPRFNPGPGSYTMPLTIHVSAPEGGTIYYTLDGSTPTYASSHVNSGETVLIPVQGVIRAFAHESVHEDSTIVSAQYDQAQARAPTFSPVAGTYTIPQTITLTSTGGGTIYYTVNGTTPTLSSSNVPSGGSFVLTATGTVKAFDHAIGFADSDVASALYAQSAAAVPTFSPVAGTYLMPQAVTASSATPASLIFYTLDGTAPTLSSANVSTGGTISITGSSVLSAFASASTYLNSAIASSTYTQISAAPSLSPTGSRYLLPLAVTASSTTGGTIFYTLDGSTPTTASLSVLSGQTISVVTESVLKVFAHTGSLVDSSITSASYTSALFYAVDFTTFATGAMVAGNNASNAFSVATNGLRLRRASTATVQVGDGAVVTGVPIDNARFGKLHDSDPVGLVMEVNRTNQLLVSADFTGATWVKDNVTIATGSYAPDGTALAQTFTTVTGSRARVFTSATLPGAANIPSLLTAWVKTGAHTPPSASLALGSLPAHYSDVLASSSWRRVSYFKNPATTNVLAQLLNNTGGPGGTGSNVGDSISWWGADVKSTYNFFPSEYIPTVGAAAATACDNLLHPTPASIIQSGTMRVEYVFRPKMSILDHSWGMYLFATSDYAVINASTSSVSVNISSVNMTFPLALQWTVNDLVEMFLVVGSCVPSLKYRVNGGPVLNLGTPAGSAQAALAIPGAISLFSNTPTNALDSSISAIRFYRAGFSPAWAL